MNLKNIQKQAREEFEKKFAIEEGELSVTKYLLCKEFLYSAIEKAVKQALDEMAMEMIGKKREYISLVEQEDGEDFDDVVFGYNQKYEELIEIAKKYGVKL